MVGVVDGTMAGVVEDLAFTIHGARALAGMAWLMAVLIMAGVVDGIIRLLIMASAVVYMDREEAELSAPHNVPPSEVLHQIAIQEPAQQ